MWQEVTTSFCVGCERDHPLWEVDARVAIFLSCAVADSECVPIKSLAIRGKKIRDVI
jgi:hypothetical protein